MNLLPMIPHAHRNPAATAIHFGAGFLAVLCAFSLLPAQPAGVSDSLQREFVTPLPSARPWVYWYFMDGNLKREGITAGLEAMKNAGIGGEIYYSHHRNAVYKSADPKSGK